MNTRKLLARLGVLVLGAMTLAWNTPIPDEKKAPAVSAHQWINTGDAAKGPDTAGKVVLVKFWHFG